MPDALIPFSHHGEVLGAGDVVRVVGVAHAFATERVEAELPAGYTVAELIEGCAGFLPPRAVVTLAGADGQPHVIPRENWRRLRPKPGTVLSFRALPQGGKNAGILRALMGLVLVAAVAFLAPYLVAAILPGLSGIGLSIATGLVGGVLTGIGQFALNALFPVRPPKLGDSGDAGTPTQSIAAAQNRANPWGPVPVVFGRHRVAPVYAAQPYTEIVGDDQYLRLLFCFGYGPLALSDFRIGETPLAQFEGVETEIRQGYDSDDPITLYPSQVFQQNFDILLDASEEETGPGQDEALVKTWHTRRTEDNIDEISVDIVFPRGLVRYQSDGDREERSATYDIEYQEVGASGWTVLGQFTQTREEPQAVRYGHRWTVARGQYDVRIRRWNRNENNQRKIDEMRWSALRGFRNEDPIAPDRPLALVALRIKASDQLNGTVDTFNAIAEAILPDWNPAASPPAWEAATTRNPAAAFLAVLQGPANARPLPDARVDFDALQAWHEYCDAQGFTFDQVRDFSASVFDTLADIAAAGRAALRYADGKWSVIVEGWDAPIAQHFTPRNSWGFQGQRAYRLFPHGWRIRFVNEEKDWSQDERIVYDDGYDAGSATRFEGLEFPGVTDPDLIWRHGRYHLAQARLRPETYTLWCDFEQLVSTRGDRVRVTHDVPLWGSASGRVKAVDGFAVTLDDLAPMADGETYVMRFRTAAGASLLFDVVTDPGEQTVVTLVDPGSSPVEMPAAGDLWMLGVVGQDSAVLRIMGIEPGPDMTAQLTLVDDAPAIADADAGEIPAFESLITAPVDLRGALPPTDLRFAEGLFKSGPAIQSIANLTWQRPAVGGPLEYEVQYRRAGAGEWTAGGTTGATAWQLVNPDGGLWDFRVRTRAAGTASSWVTLSGQEIEGLLGPPEDVASFRCQIVGTVATLSWTPVADLDLSHYEIRFQPVTTGASWQNALVLEANASGTSLQTAALVGTWLIKAVDSSGVYSDNAALVVSSVAGVAGLNVVELLDEAAASPVFAGTAEPDSDNVTVDAGALRLADVDVVLDDEDVTSIEGIYVFAQSIDLGASYTSRLTGTVHVSGTDLEDDVFSRADWFAVDDYFGGLIDGYEVELQARWTDDDPSGSPVAWSAWTPFLAMDVTARAFQFRLILRSFQQHVTPVVTGLSVEIDMPDRVLAAEDVTAPDTGLSVSFAPGFKEIPAIAVTVQDGATGDYAEITSKTASGFNVIVKNSGGAGVERTIDWIAKGYGVAA